MKQTAVYVLGGPKETQPSWGEEKGRDVNFACVAAASPGKKREGVLSSPAGETCTKETLDTPFHGRTTPGRKKPKEEILT